jgi:hypothetical protein
MCKDYSKFVEEEIKKRLNNGFEYGKTREVLEFNGRKRIDEMEKELSSCRNLVYTNKKIESGEVRYTLYFVYSKRNGTAYAITFREKTRVITVFHLGKKTLLKYHRKRFINKEGLN